MKLSSIAIAVAAVAAAPSFAAVTTINAAYGVTPANTFYVSGSSAIGGTFKAIVGGLCSGGAANVVEFVNGTQGQIEVCKTFSTKTGFPSAAPFAIVKLDAGGSYTGVYGVLAKAAGIANTDANLSGWPDVNAIDTATFTVAQGTTRFDADAALSDVDRNVWVGFSKTNTLGGAKVIATPSANVTFSNNFGGQSFALAVSDALYTDLQANQIATHRLPSTCVAGDFTTGTCQPSVSSQEYAAIINATASSYSTAPASFVGATAASGFPSINVCRRSVKSGTQANSNAYFLKNPCNNASPEFGFAKPTTATGAADAVSIKAADLNNTTGAIGTYSPALTTFEGSATGDVLLCLSQRNAGTGNLPNGVADAANGNYAIGVVGTDVSIGGAGVPSGWHYVRLNGVSADFDATGAADPTHRKNVVAGLYDFVSEMEMLWDKTGTNATAMQALRDELATPENTVNSVGYYQLSGQINPKTKAALTNVGYPTQVSKGTRSGNLCAPIVLQE